MKKSNVVGKILTIKIIARNESGKQIPNTYTSIKGLCSYFGYNDVLDINQITINRIPIYPFDESMIIKIHN